ncbi:hypothetical protein [Pedobacter insulae]|uniref:Uncharacterized protein n=1 Tax=Pedobacter insulae TaxID=414048 RepID=A0A1I3AMQ6_9SPHI|nr:hypothetical protein [Pedobacter insulae]SFH51347.1 hypothetical protein SAMN04489864_1171 [Pedobacter insulae]
MTKITGIITPKYSALILSFSSCEKINTRSIDTIGYGSSFGMCVGYCNHSLSISENKVTFVKKANSQTSPDTKTCSSTLAADEAKVFKDLMEDSKIAALPKTIGCPDCADGGAEWVSVTTGSKEYKVVFEYGKEPKELKAIVKKLRALSETFNNCN